MSVAYLNSSTRSKLTLKHVLTNLWHAAVFFLAKKLEVYPSHCQNMITSENRLVENRKPFVFNIYSKCFICVYSP